MKKFKINKLWLHRFIWAPTLLLLNFRHSVLKALIEEQQKIVYHMIEKHGHFYARPHIKKLEGFLERIADLDKKIEELWSGQALKKG